MRIFITLILLSASILLKGQSGESLFDISYLHEIRIEFEQDSFWDTLTNNYELFSQFSGSDIPYLEANIIIDGTAINQVGTRLKGKSSYFYTNQNKKPFKIDLNEYIEDQNFDGLKKFNLHNAIGDPGMARDKISFNMMRAVGVNAPRVAFCQLYLNDEYWGVYEIVEQVDKTFLKNNFANGNGNLYKNQRWSDLLWYGSDPETYKDTFELKTNTEEDDWTDFINLLDIINNSSDESFPEQIQSIFNVDQFLHVLAIDIMINNWDSYIDNSRNFYLYQEPESGQFQWIPWDYNLSMGGRLVIGGNPFPPYDPNCQIQNTFNFTTNEQEVTFSEYAEPSSDSWLWEFGDGEISSEQNPIHTFSNTQIYTVCLTSSINDCEQKRCKQVDLTFNPGSCTTIQNGTCPYPSNDPVFQLVIAEDDYCCEDEWDVFCNIAYAEIQNNPTFELGSGVNYSTDYPLFIDNPDKVLINRILAVPSFRDRYLDICCLIEENYFNENYLYAQIDFQADLLRDAIFEDPNYLYSIDYFEYDLGNGTGGGDDAKIPPLKYFFDQRFPQIQNDLIQTGHDCSAANTSLMWKNIVINEFVASNTEGSGTPDQDGEYDDWIELYNNTNDTIFLFGFYLSDDLTMQKKWAFPQGSFIEPYAYLIIWADKDPGQDGLHANFKLSKSGDQLLLVHEDGTWIDFYDFDIQMDDLAAARVPNGTGDFIFQSSSQGLNNDLINATKESNFNPRIIVFPNPSQQYLNIDFNQFKPTNKKVEISLYSQFGKNIFSNTYNLTPKVKIDLSQFNLNSGVFILEVETDDLLFNRKIIFLK